MAEVHYRVSLSLGEGIDADRLCALLQGVARRGSINRAAADLGLSYRHAWGLVKKAEERLGVPLLTRRAGGEGGGGAELTAAADALLARWRRAQAMVGSLAVPDTAPTPAQAAAAPVPLARPLLLASTIGPVEAGVVPALEEAFYRETGLLVRHIAAGSGQALDIARDGRADLVLTHAPAMEAEFIAAGYGTGRYPLMYNEFLLLGPPADPAGVRGAPTAAEAMRRIAAAWAPFVSRGDRSGTHMKELALWSAAGVIPGAPWYQVYERGAMGSGATLRHAAAAGAYTLADRATWLAASEPRKSSSLPTRPPSCANPATGAAGLAVLLAGDPALRNEFALIPVRSGPSPAAPAAAAERFVAWATGPGGQALIRTFGQEQYGSPLFFPAAG